LTRKGLQESHDSFVIFHVMKVFSFFLALIATTVVFAQQKKVRPEELFEQGQEAHDQGDYTKALALLNQCLTERPGFTEAYYIRASAREQLKDFEGALTDYSIYLERKPDNSEALFSRGLIRYQLKKYDQAYEDFTRYLNVPPGATQTLYFNRSPGTSGNNPITTAQSGNRPLIYNYLGVIDQKQNNLQRSVAWLDSAIRLSPKEADFYVNRGLSKQSMKDSTAALDDFNKALSINPRHPVALHNIAVFKRLKGERKASEDPLEQAIDSDSSMLAPYLERAYQRLEGGYLKGALDDYNKALEIEPKDPEIWLSRGIVKERMKDYTGAFSDYTKAIDLKEGFVKAWINRANVLLKQERYADAVEDYTAALIYTPDSAPAYYNRAIARYKLNKYTEACEDLKKAEALGFKPEAKLKDKICTTK
jgi:tetratricopeptide (TPR) repeat protein